MYINIYLYLQNFYVYITDIFKDDKEKQNAYIIKKCKCNINQRVVTINKKKKAFIYIYLI